MIRKFVFISIFALLLQTSLVTAGTTGSEELKDSEYVLSLLGSSKSQILKITEPNFISEDNFIIWIKNNKTYILFW